MSAQAKAQVHSLINVQQLTSQVNTTAKKRRRKHTNLYARLQSLLRGGVYSADEKLVDDVLEVVEREHAALVQFLQSAKTELAGQ